MRAFPHTASDNFLGSLCRPGKTTLSRSRGGYPPTEPKITIAEAPRSADRELRASSARSHGPGLNRYCTPQLQACQSRDCLGRDAVPTNPEAERLSRCRCEKPIRNTHLVPRTLPLLPPVLVRQRSEDGPWCWPARLDSLDRSHQQDASGLRVKMYAAEVGSSVMAGTSGGAFGAKRGDRLSTRSTRFYTPVKQALWKA